MKNDKNKNQAHGQSEFETIKNAKETNETKQTDITTSNQLNVSKVKSKKVSTTTKVPELKIDVKNNSVSEKEENSNKKFTKRKKLVRFGITIGIIVVFLLMIYIPLKLSGAIEDLSDSKKIQDIILAGGSYSYILFMLIQFLQVTFVPLPAMLTTIAGVWVFGPWQTFAMSMVAVLLGSLFAFWLGKTFGQRLIKWIIGEEDAKKWNAKLAKGKYVFFLMMLLPGFPDDILCILAGATPMTYRFFTITNLITRPIVFASICFLGSGVLIPFSGWGIPVWIVLIALAAVAFFLSIKYSSQIEKFFDNKIEKINTKLTKK